MAPTSKPLTWKRLFEAADLLDDRACTKDHADAAFFLLLKCAVETHRKKAEQAERPRRRTFFKSSPAMARMAASASASRVAVKNMTDAEVLALARRLARL